MAVGSGGIGHLLINWAHEHVDLAVMSLLTLAVPVMAVTSAAIFLDEPIEAVQVGGMAIVIAALAVVSVPQRRHEVVDGERAGGGGSGRRRRLTPAPCSRGPCVRARRA